MTTFDEPKTITTEIPRCHNGWQPDLSEVIAADAEAMRINRFAHVEVSVPMGRLLEVGRMIDRLAAHDDQAVRDVAYSMDRLLWPTKKLLEGTP